MSAHGYEADVVFAFIYAHSARLDDGRLATINDHKLKEGHREMLIRWTRMYPDRIPLTKVDELLMKYDLSIIDLEDWAEEHYGRNPYKAPAQLPTVL